MAGQQKSSWILRKRNQFFLLIAAEALLAVYFIVKLLSVSGSQIIAPDTLNGIMKETEDGYIMPSSFDLTDTDEEGVLQAVYKNLPANTYLAVVRYSADEKQLLSISSSTEEYVKANDELLNEQEDEVGFIITVTHPLEELGLNARYSGSGEFTIREISLSVCAAGYLKKLLLVLVLFSLAELGLWYYYRNQKGFKTLLILIGIAVVAFIPYLSTGYVLGHDFDFHYLRIEGLADAMAGGQFPVYMQRLWMHGYGSPVSIYYGDLLLYFPAALRMLGFTHNFAYKAFVFLITFGTSAFSYWSFKRIFKDRNVSLLMTLVYTCAPYRLLDIYVRNAMGEYCSIMFFPLLAAGIYGILTWRPDDKKTALRENGIITAFAASGILYCHLLSAEMTAVICVIVLIFTIRLWWNKEKIIEIILTCINTLILCLGFLIPFAHSMRANDIMIKHKVGTETAAIQSAGAQIGEILTPFKDIYGLGDSASQTADRMYMSIGMVLLLTLAFALIMGMKKKLSKRAWFYLIMTLIALFLSTNLFPYDTLSFTSIGNLLAQIQFPWRYLIYATFFAVLVLGELLIFGKSAGKKAFTVLCYVVGAAVLVETAFMSASYSTMPRNAIYNLNEVGTDRDSAEYLRINTNNALFDYQPSADDAEISEVKNNKTIYSLYCKTGDKESAVTVPVLRYKGYVVRDEYGNEIETADGANNQITFILPAGFEGIVNVTFEPVWFWTAAKWISLIWAVFLVILCMRRNRRSKNPDPV